MSETSEKRLEELEAEVESLRALVMGLVVALHEQRVASVSKTKMLGDFVRRGLPALFPGGTNWSDAPSDRAVAFLQMEQGDSPTVRLLLEAIHTSPHAQIVREHHEHALEGHYARILGDQLAHELKQALQKDRRENCGEAGPSRLG